MIKRLLIAVVLLGVVCGGIVYFNMFRNQAIQDFFATMEAPPVAVSAQTAEAGEWQPGLEAIGTVSAAAGIDVAVETSGVVEAVNFGSNDQVEQGDVLVELDDSIEQADLEAARAAVLLSEQTLARATTLQSRGVSAEANVQEAEASAQSNRAQVARLEAVLRQKVVTAPFSGTIGIPSVEVGQYISAGTVVATLQDLETMRVDFTVPEQSRQLVRIGQTIRLGSEDGDLRYTGEITGVEPRIDPATRLVTVRATVTNEDGALNPGQFARVRVELPVEDNIIALPQTAVVTSLYGDYVYAVRPLEEQEAEAAEAAIEEQEAAAEGGGGAAGAPAAPEGTDAEDIREARQIFVGIGRRNGSLLEITEGVAEGDVIVTAGQNRLSNGARVVVNGGESPLQRSSEQPANTAEAAQ
jgi:membrane fusion protein (multidrug efflux system)